MKTSSIVVPCCAAAWMFLIQAANGGSDPGRGDQQKASEASRGLPVVLKGLLPLHTPLGKPQPGEWRYDFNEPDQSFTQYLASRPRRVDGQRKVIYVQPLGRFDGKQRRILDDTVEFLAPTSSFPSRSARTYA